MQVEARSGDDCRIRHEIPLVERHGTRIFAPKFGDILHQLGERFESIPDQLDRGRLIEIGPHLFQE